MDSSVNELLASICLKAKCSIPSIERILDLDSGTFNTQDPALLPLLKIIDTFPWLLSVAEKDFRPQQAVKYLMYAAIEESLKDNQTKIKKASNQKFRRHQPLHKDLYNKVETLCKNISNDIP